MLANVLVVAATRQPVLVLVRAGHAQGVQRHNTFGPAEHILPTTVNAGQGVGSSIISVEVAIVIRLFNSRAAQRAVAHRAGSGLVLHGVFLFVQHECSIAPIYRAVNQKKGLLYFYNRPSVLYFRHTAGTSAIYQTIGSLLILRRTRLTPVIIKAWTSGLTTKPYWV